jgi:hypothetical protein
VGAGIKNNKIIKAEPTRFKFRGIFPEEPNHKYTVEIVVEEMVAEKGYPLQVYRDDNLEMGPFWLSNNSIFTYYNENEEETEDKTRIYSVKVELELFYDSFTEDIGVDKIKNKVVFWEYFKNIYLQ